MTSTNSDKNKLKTPEAVSSFIKKTYAILDDAKFPDIVDWNEEGTAIIIKKPTEFGQKVLSTYFKHSNLTSFVRQLNMYGFHKRRTHKYDHVYYHDSFQRGKKFLLQEIKRKNQETTLATIQKAIETLEVAQTGQEKDSSINVYENQLLKKINKDTLARVASLESKVKDLTIQNQALWNQLAHQKQKEDVLVSFLASFIKKKGVTLNQLPSVLKNQFNLDVLSYESDMKSFGEGMRSLANGKFLGAGMSNSSLNVGDFLNFGESSSNSTGISPENEKLMGHERNMVNIEYKAEDTMSNTGAFNQEDMYHKIDADKNFAYSMMRTMGNKDYSTLGKRFFEESDLHIKRNFSGETEDNWEMQKLIKQDPFQINHDMSPFMANPNMHVKKIDGYTDMFHHHNKDNQSYFPIDLMNFNNFS